MKVIQFMARCSFCGKVYRRWAYNVLKFCSYRCGVLHYSKTDTSKILSVRGYE